MNFVARFEALGNILALKCMTNFWLDAKKFSFYLPLGLFKFSEFLDILSISIPILCGKKEASETNNKATIATEAEDSKTFYT